MAAATEEAPVAAPAAPTETNTKTPPKLVSDVSSASLESSTSSGRIKKDFKKEPSADELLKPVREEAIAVGIKQRIAMLQKMAKRAEELEKKSWDTFKANDLKNMMLVSGREMESDMPEDAAEVAMKRNRERRKSRGGRKSPKKMSLVPPVDGEEPKPADATVPEEEEEEEEDDDEDYEESEDDDEEDVNRPIAHPEPTPEPKVEEPKVEEPKVEEPKVEVEVEEPKIEEPKAEEPKVEEPKSEEPKVEEPKPAAEPYVLSENAKKALEYSPSLGEDHARAVREALDRRLPLSEEAEELARMAREMLEEISQMLDREAPQIGEEETLEMRGQLAKVKMILDTRAEFAKIHRERARDFENKLLGLDGKINDGKKEIDQIEREYEEEMARLAVPGSPPPVMKYKNLEPAAPPAPKDIKARLEPVPSSADFVHTRKVYLIFAIPPPVPQGCIVRYTLDGSEPKPGNANSFVAPLTVKAARLKSTAIVKWVVEDGRGGRMGPVEERNYKVERPWYKKVRKAENGPGQGQQAAAQKKAALQTSAATPTIDN